LAIQYNLYWSLTSGAGVGGTKISNVTSPYVHTGLIPGTPYYYVITAYDTDTALESDPSVEVPGVPFPGPFYTIPMGMARIVRTSDGAPVPNAIIRVYLAGTSTPVIIYDSILSTTPVFLVTSDAEGRYLIFVDATDYPITTTFKLVTTWGSQTTTEDYVR